MLKSGIETFCRGKKFGMWVDGRVENMVWVARILWLFGVEGMSLDGKWENSRWIESDLWLQFLGLRGCNSMYVKTNANQPRSSRNCSLEYVPIYRIWQRRTLPT